MRAHMRAIVTGWCQKGHENDAHGAQHARPDKALHHAAEWVRFFLFFLHEPGPPVQFKFKFKIMMNAQ